MKQILSTFTLISTSSVLVFLVLISCNSRPDKAYKSPPGYDLNHPHKFFMPESLLEISGITFHNYNADTAYTIQDENGKVFRLVLGEKKPMDTKFGKQGDYEDVAIMDETVFVLKSNGTLFSFPFSDRYKEEPDSVTEWKDLVPEEEYESIAADPAAHKLYLLCKNCNEDKKSNHVSGYTFEWTNGALINPTAFSVNTDKIYKTADKKQASFRPSAMAKNPGTGEWYIISAINNVLVVADTAWAVKEVYPISPAVFNQPEGMAFDKAGNLYISNEGDDVSNGNVLKFDYKGK